MKKLVSITPLLIIIFSLLFISSPSFGASIKDRMAARIPEISSLKDKGVIGENNKGFLEFRSGDKSKQGLINAENKDRKAVYGAIAEKQGVSAVLVGERRAKQIAQKGKKGQWFQSADGKWYKK